MRRIRVTFLASALALGLVGMATAGPIEDGRAAYHRGDYASAVKLWRPSAEQGDVAAAFYLGTLFTNPGPMQDVPQGRSWFLKAAQAGHVKAQVTLGAMYLMGGGGAPDPEQALIWFRRASDQGNAEAQAFLGMMYGAGEGVPQDFNQAAQWYQKAADEGFAGAQLMLGFMCEQGKGIPQDIVKAHMWWNLAVSGSPPADAAKVAQNRDRLAAKMTPSQLGESNRLAVAWLQQHVEQSPAGPDPWAP